MELFDKLWDSVNLFIDIPYLFTFMLLGYLIKHYFGETLKKKNIKMVYVVLSIAAVIAVPYVLTGSLGWREALFTYTLGTSLHELFFKLIEQKLTVKP